MAVPRSISRWLITGLGAFALIMGVVGLLSPDRQAAMMGFPDASTRAPEDHTLTLLVITSLATINTALLYLVAAAKRWPGFPALAIVARTIMGAGLATLAATGQGPGSFVGAAVWEWIGAALILVTSSWDRRRGAIGHA